ncbi:MAG: AsmA-like C-terminal domain-containing protein [Rhodospirillales bacterium]|nr:AsmA-like C-terminal domain-containing protein [Rhodospirillales bacterium]
MVHGTVRGLFQLIGAMFLIVLVAVPFLVWRLSEGPLSLSVLTPYIEEALRAPDGSFAVKLDDTVLSLAGRERILDIRAKGVRALGPDGRLVAAVPEISVSLSARALLGGVVGVRAVRIWRPSLSLIRETNGRIDIGVTARDEAATAERNVVIERLLAELLGPPDSTRPSGALNQVEVRDARITLIDRKTSVTWHAPAADLELHRDPEGIAGGGTLLLELDGVTAGLAVQGRYRASARVADLVANFAEIDPGKIARRLPELDMLAAIDMPLGGMVNLVYDFTHGVERVAFELTGGKGRLKLPKPIAADYAVSSLFLKGTIERSFTRLAIEEFFVDLGGPTAQIQALADGLGGPLRLAVEARAQKVPANSLRHLWPATLAADPRSWVAFNLTDGIVHEANVRFTTRTDDKGKTELVSLSGGGTVENITVDYLPPMPKVRGAAAKLTFDPKFIRLDITDGRIHDLRAKSGTLIFTGFETQDFVAALDLDIEGPFADALRVLESKPLEFSQAIGIRPETAKGQARTRLKIDFPVEKALKPKQVKVLATSHLTGVALPKVLFGMDVAEGELDLRVDAATMDARGTIRLGTIAADIDWHEAFQPAPGTPKSRYRLSGAVDAQGRKELGLSGPPFDPPYLEGPVGTDVMVSLNAEGKGEAAVKLDLTAAAMALPPFAWTKKAGAGGAADVTLTVGLKGVAALPRIRVRAEGLDARGSAAFAREGGPLSRIDFFRFRLDRADLEGSLTVVEDGGLAVEAKGKSFDLQRLIEDKSDPSAKPLPLRVALDVERLWISEKGGLDRVKGAMRRQGERWTDVDLKAEVDGGKPFTFTIRPEGKGRTLSVASPDAGAALRSLALYENMVGGTLALDGKFDDAKPDRPLAGTLRIEDYHVIRAPVLTRLLTVAALTGIVDLLSGQGVGFSKLEAPFVMAANKITVRDMRTAGLALGLTAKGNIDLAADQLALEGTIVPAYLVNSLLGNIPVLGNIFTGGDKGGGLLAFTYTMKGPVDDPSVSVNPLAALAPGFLRNLFGIFDTPPPDAAPAPPKPPG